MLVAAAGLVLGGGCAAVAGTDFDGVRLADRAPEDGNAPLADDAPGDVYPGCSGSSTCSGGVDSAQSIPSTSDGSSATYTLTLSKAGSGSGTVTSSPAGISCGATCSASYTSGTSVTLTASPDGGFSFGGWSGGGCSGTGTCTVTMAAAQSVTATFNASCGEDSCVASQGAYISHFEAANCGGSEAYYTPYDSGGYQCRSWDGGGKCGTTLRTLTVYSWRNSDGMCHDDWPGGNTLSGFVYVYR